MIVLDTNYLVRWITAPGTPHEQQMADAARRLVLDVANGLQQVTTCDANLAEMVYLLTGNQFLASRSEISNGLTQLLLLPGFVAPQKSVWIAALELWRQQSALSFVDALSAAYSLNGHFELATFDKRLSRHPGLNIYRPTSD